MSLEIKNLNFKIDEFEILKDINLNVKKSKFVGILGPNGCGKSTLLKNILRIYEPNSGIIKFENRKMSDYSLKELSKLIGFVPQKSAISMPLSVEDIVLMGRYSHLKNSFVGYEKSDYLAVDKILKKLDLERFKKRVAFSLSGGEFQRVILARALVGEPKILLLDEPTSALDLNFSVSMLKICKNLVKDLNILGVVVIHDLNLASGICDEIFMMKNGVVSYRGTPKELFKKEILKDIYNLDCEILEFQNRAVVVTI
ncbi:ABC transporter ATP-binding protein [Campylobacter sp. FMV-PI01]|uniref:ABC transporter ATP-binding protein n=1 Tax=Campylobacter portucalensis TaxID=2608384 RepID=A0A6L5WIR0_9BACT|nr:ABC transporter ATP-binding protein [Campylobacter portucalensis]MSN96856.1 ABC transporter ATP-binding protein [Campylobacter portucalensis]